MIPDQLSPAHYLRASGVATCRCLLPIGLTLLCLAADPIGWICGSAGRGSARAQSPSGNELAVDVDLGLFARVVTSDPTRIEGAKAGRLEEFRAEDVFLTAQLAPRPDATYSVSMDPSVGGVIGLEWSERRVLRRLELECVSPPTIASPPVIEYWSSSGREDSWGTIGQTPWQGRWEPLPAKIEVEDGRWLTTIADNAIPEFQKNVGVLRVRWRFPAGTSEIIVKRPSAFGTSVWQREALRIETVDASHIAVDVYNGLLVDPDSERQVLHRTGTTREPWPLTAICSRSATSKADRTLLRCHLPSGTVSIAVEDVLAAGQVFVRALGLLVSRADAPQPLAAYRQKIAGEQTILSRVREMPDQSFAEAMEALWRPAQNHGPTMLSLACDNAKFIVERDGGVRFGQLTLRPRFPLMSVEVTRLDFGMVGLDTTVRPSETATPLPLRIAEKTFQKGLGLHANADLAVSLEGRYEAFTAEVGVLSSQQPGGTVVFQVDVDGRRQYDSGVVRQGEPPRKIHVNVAGAQQLALHVTDAGDGILNDAANWGEARLLPAGPDGGEPLFVSDLLARQAPPPATCSRTLESRWLPIVVNTSQVDDILLRQRTWVAPRDEVPGDWDHIGRTRALGVTEMSVENCGRESAEVSLRLDRLFAPATSDSPPLETQTEGDRVLWIAGDQLLGMLDLAKLKPLVAAVDPAGIHLSGQLPAGAASELVAYLPAWTCLGEEHSQFPPVKELHERVGRYWHELLDPAMQIEVPEPLVEDLFRATQVHCLIAARNENEGRRVAPWIASDTYGPLDTEAQPVILGMSVVGQREFARRGLDFFIASYNSDGLLAKGYTLMGTGQHLWTLGEHDALHPDPRWLEQIAPEIVKPCRWIVRQTEKTKRLDINGQRVPEYGLAPPGVLADWDRYAYYFYANAYYSAGLDAATDMLSRVRPEEAAELRTAAAEYRADVLRAFRWQRAQMPVVPLRDGTWVSPCPSSLNCFGLTREFFGGVSAMGHDVEVGGNHLISLGLLAPEDAAADAIVDFLEDHWFLMDGIFEAYPADENEADWFNRGGFAKLQPHYARTTDIHALRDDVRPFIRTYFNTFPVLLNRENLTYWEHMNHGGAWNKTHESAWFLQMTRTMLLTERGDELWLAPFVTTHWLQSQMHVSVANAPTRFGTASYTLRSAVADGYIEAVIQSPTRQPPARIVLRVRHPEGQPMRSVTVDAQPHLDFDPAAQLVYLAPTDKPITVRIGY
ncbi:MAG: NPCBM/NEW2 domain-containing protein [Pirellulaceae bacterium]